MSVYTKSKTNVSNLKTVEFDESKESFKVEISEGATNLILDYLSGLYSNAPVAIVRELTTNAFDASPKNSPVKLVIKESEKELGLYTFVVIDMGCGMSKKEMEDNYIIYVNSNKTDDLSKIGSFGLGSKSPLALVPSYIVTSNNGKEENCFKVSRTDRGMFAFEEPTEEINDFSFTKVEVDGLSEADATTMHKYITQFIKPYANHALIIDSCFDFIKVKGNFTKNYQIKLLQNFTTTVYTENPEIDVLKAFRGNIPKESWLVRINDIVYPLFRGERTPHFRIVIDVEPGYFAFAPNREELPSGEKLEHLQSLALHYSGDITDEINFLLDSKLFSKNQITNLYRRIQFKPFYEMTFKGELKFKKIINKLGKENVAKIKAVVNFIENGIWPKYNQDKISIIKYKRDYNKLFKRSNDGDYSLRDSIIESCHEINNYYSDPLTMSSHNYSSAKGPRHCSRIIVVNNTKFNKHNLPIINASLYGVRAITEKMTKEANDYAEKILDSYHYYGPISAYVAFIAKGYKIPSDFKYLLSFLNTNLNENDIYFEPKEIDMEYSERKNTGRKIIPAKDKEVTLSYYDGHYYRTQYHGKLKDLDLDNFIFANKDYGAAFNLVTEIASNSKHPIMVIDNKTKMVKNYLTKKGNKFIELSIEKNYYKDTVTPFTQRCECNEELSSIVKKNSKIFQYLSVEKNGAGAVDSSFDKTAYAKELFNNDTNKFLNFFAIDVSNRAVTKKTSFADYIAYKKDKKMNSDAFQTLIRTIGFRTDYASIFGQRSSWMQDNTEELEQNKKLTTNWVKKYLKISQLTKDLFPAILYSKYEDTLYTLPLSRYTDYSVQGDAYDESTLFGYESHLLREITLQLISAEFDKLYTEMPKTKKTALQRLQDHNVYYPALKYNNTTFDESNKLDQIVKAEVDKDLEKMKKDAAKVFTNIEFNKQN